MTDCTKASTSFSPLSRKKIEASFSGGTITSNAGLLLLKEMGKKMRLRQRLQGCMDDRRDPGKVVHHYPDMILQRVYAIASGYEDVNDHSQLRHDPILQLSCQLERPLASSSTLCRFENKATRDACIHLSKLLVELFIEQHPKPQKELVLDFDATEDKVHGEQEQRFFNGFYKSYCFLPLMVFCGDQLLTSYLRPSNIDGARHAWAILSLLVKRLRQVWPDVTITFRGDCGFCRDRMLNWCQRHQVQYIVGMPKNGRLMQAISKDIERAKQAYEQAKQTHEQTKQVHQQDAPCVRCFVQFQYAAKSWTLKRTMVARIQYDDYGPSIRFIATNITGYAQKHYESRYCARGNMENKIKQMKLDLGSGRTSCHAFVANQFRLLLSALAYVLLQTLQAFGLKRTSLKRAYIGTIRNKLIKIGAVITRNTRRIKLMLDSHYPMQDLFIRLTNKLTAT